MSHRVNVIFDDEVWEQLEAIPKGERSQLINEAVAEIMLRRKRQVALERIRERSRTMEPFGMSAEDWIRQDRDSHLS